MDFLLWIVAVVLIIWGLIHLFSGAFLFGIILIIVGCLIGPGGTSVFRR